MHQVKSLFIGVLCFFALQPGVLAESANQAIGKQAKATGPAYSPNQTQSAQAKAQGVVDQGNKPLVNPASVPQPSPTPLQAVLQSAQFPAVNFQSPRVGADALEHTVSTSQSLTVSDQQTFFADEGWQFQGPRQYRLDVPSGKLTRTIYQLDFTNAKPGIRTPWIEFKVGETKVEIDPNKEPKRYLAELDKMIKMLDGHISTSEKYKDGLADQLKAAKSVLLDIRQAAARPQTLPAIPTVSVYTPTKGIYYSATNNQGNIVFLSDGILINNRPRYNTVYFLDPSTGAIVVVSNDPTKPNFNQSRTIMPSSTGEYQDILKAMLGFIDKTVHEKEESRKTINALKSVKKIIQAFVVIEKPRSPERLAGR